MKLPITSIRLFGVAVHLWLLGYVLSALPAAEWLWELRVAKIPGPPGPFRYLTHAFGTWLPNEVALPCVGVLLVLVIIGLFRPARWWSSAIIWVLYTSLMNQAWLASSGGEQLISNVLFWMILLPHAAGSEHGGRPWIAEIVGTSAFWIIRLQLVLAYMITAIHKLSGELWTSGQAVGVVASDPGYGPSFLIGHLALTTALTYAVLLFQIGFPLAMWWKTSRMLWLGMGVLFHVGTAVGMGIPDMAFAFIACYPIWLDERTSVRLVGWFQPRWRKMRSATSAW